MVTFNLSRLSRETVGPSRRSNLEEDGERFWRMSMIRKLEVKEKPLKEEKKD